MRYVIATEDAVIALGRQGENEVTTVQIDVSGWEEEYGTGTFTLVHQRCNDGDGYEREITVADDILSWVITNVDVAYAGRGRLQLTYTVDEVVAKSVIYHTKVLPSLDAEETVPDPWKPWVDSLEEYRDEAEGYATNAGLSEAAASEYAGSAEDSAEDAEAWAVGQRDGVDVGSSDETYHNNSKYYANHVADILDDAVETATSEAAGYASNASASANSALTYSANASDSASAAAQSALEAASFVGAPLVASSAAGMTDHTRVYVYTGSETGYTSGNWYYWNGTAWTSGGVYNASAVDVATTADINTALYS